MKFGLIRNGLRLAALGLIGALQVGCPAPPVGDPCTPEQIPAGGFDDNEAYVETSSVQCETRVCMVYKLAGDPRCLQGDPTAPDFCREVDPATGGPKVVNPLPDEVRRRIYCTCRCDAANAAFATCECPDGYSCQPVLELGGPGVQGSYCVKKGTY